MQVYGLQKGQVSTTTAVVEGYCILLGKKEGTERQEWFFRSRGSMCEGGTIGVYGYWKGRVVLSV